MTLDILTLLDEISAADPVATSGRVNSLVGLSARATLPGAKLGDRVVIERVGNSPLDAEVVAFDQDDVTLMPVGDVTGARPGDVVRGVGRPFEVRCGWDLLGRVLDGLGAPIDGGPPLNGEFFSIERAAPNPLARPRIDQPMHVGIRSIDGLLTLGRGQRVGLFAGSGVGKSKLLGQIARQCEAEITVICLVGERGREVREFIDDNLGAEGLKHTVLVCATSDNAPLVRLKCADVAMAVAEWFRDQGKHVMLMMDSVTRYARAAREVGLASGELPARRGYPPSVFARLPKLLERSGTGARGSITGIFTVLVEGSDMDEPIADEIRGILDGHIVLDRNIAARGRFPAIDVLQSLSRVMTHVTDASHQAAALAFRKAAASYESKRDLIEIGAYKSGTDPDVDRSVELYPTLEAFLSQAQHESADFEASLTALRRLVKT